MVTCKKCNSDKIVKSGIVGKRQRFFCKTCGYNFRLGDKRTNEQITAKKTMCILWYSMGTVSFRMMGKLFQTDHTLIHRWIRNFAKNLPEPKSHTDLKQLNFDELWRFVDLKKENFEALKQLIINSEKLLPKHITNTILQHLNEPTKILNT